MCMYMTDSYLASGMCVYMTLCKTVTIQCVYMTLCKTSSHHPACIYDVM